MRGSQAAWRWCLMYQPLVEVGGGGSLEVFPQTGPAPPCVSALLGHDDPYCKSSVLSVCPVHSAVPYRTARFRFWPPASTPSAQQNPTSLRRRSFGVAAFAGRMPSGKDVILLCLLAKFPAECSFSSISRTTSIQGAQPVSCSAARGDPMPRGCPRLPSPCQRRQGDLGLQDVSEKPAPPVRMDI